MDNNMENQVDHAFRYNGLPVLVADDDFIEHLHEQGFETIEFDELVIEYDDWASENVE